MASFYAYTKDSSNKPLRILIPDKEVKYIRPYQVIVYLIQCNHIVAVYPAAVSKKGNKAECLGWATLKTAGLTSIEADDNDEEFDCLPAYINGEEIQ